MLVALLLPLVAAAADKHNATIDHVTIFANGAQVQRSKTVNLTEGEQVVTFTGLSPYLDVKSMQVKAKGQLTVLGISHRTTHPDSALQVQRLKQADDGVKAVERSIQQIKDEKEVIAAQRELVKTNCSVAGRTVATPLVGIKELNSYYSQEILSLNKRSQELDNQLEKLSVQLERKKTARDSIARQKMKTVMEIDVKVDVKRAGRVDFSLAYYVKNAGWFPSYDVRSSSTHEPLKLSYKANIFQNTGEEWKNVPVTLSSANPSLTNVAPELKTYWLDFGLAPPTYDFVSDGNTVTGRVVSADDGDPLIGATVTVKGTKLGTVTDVDGRYSITLPQGKRQLSFAYIGYVGVTRTVSGNSLNVRLSPDEARLDEVKVVAYGTSKSTKRRSAKARSSEPMLMKEAAVMVEEAPEMEESTVIEVEQQKAQFGYEFDIKQLLTIPASGKSVTTEIARYELPATYEYRGIPKIEKEAFLVADATKWSNLNLLEGEANVYFDNSFVGKSILDPSISSDTLHFSMGRDQSIRLQRVKVNEKSSRSFIGSNQEQTLTWRITVKNTRQEQAMMTVYDQTPISRNSNINVTVEELSGGIRDEKTGIVRWNLQLQPGEQRDLILQYKVKYPKSRRLTIE